jgi:hypothetical protein
LDETEAALENDLIEKDKEVKVEMEQDHNIHIITHLKLEESKVKDKHIEIHQQALYLLRKNQQILAQSGMQAGTTMQKQPIEMPNSSIPEQSAAQSANSKTQPSSAPTQTTNIPNSYQQPTQA